MQIFTKEVLDAFPLLTLEDTMTLDKLDENMEKCPRAFVSLIFFKNLVIINTFQCSSVLLIIILIKGLTHILNIENYLSLSVTNC